MGAQTMNAKPSNRKTRLTLEDCERVNDPHRLASQFVTFVKVNHGVKDNPFAAVEYYGDGDWQIMEDCEPVKVNQERIEIELYPFIREEFEKECKAKYEFRKQNPKYLGEASETPLPKIRIITTALVRDVILALKSYCYVNPKELDK